MNPYVPPTSEERAPKRTAKNVFWTRAFVTVSVMRIGLIAALFVASAISPKLDASVAQILVEVWPWASTVAQILFYVDLVCAGRWLTNMWDGLPREDWKVGTIRTTPPGAVAYLCIPLFNYYWMFAMNLALCERYESRAYRPRRKETDLSGRGLVWSAGGLSILGLIGALGAVDGASSAIGVFQYATQSAASLFWIFYMRHLDTLRERLGDT